MGRMPVTDRRGRASGQQAPSDNQNPAHSCRPVHTAAISKRLASVMWQRSLLKRFYHSTLGERGGKSFFMTSSACLEWDALVWLSQHTHLPRSYHSSVYTTWRIGNAWQVHATCRLRLSVTCIRATAWHWHPWGCTDFQLLAEWCQQQWCSQNFLPRGVLKTIIALAMPWALHARGVWGHAAPENFESRESISCNLRPFLGNFWCLSSSWIFWGFSAVC